MELIQTFIDIVLHLDVHLNQWAAVFGPWLYVVLFAIVFCETGLVVTPFLPGDSLLFAVGALAATENSVLSLPVLAVSLVAAGIIGDAVNYSIGRYLGPRVFNSEMSKLFNKKHLEKTQLFYEKHGGKTIILARFMPIIRTFAPFVAGMGEMKYSRFAAYNIVGGITWVMSFLLAGYYFGHLPAIKSNFHIVIIAIIVISFMPVAIEFLRARMQGVKPTELS